MSETLNSSRTESAITVQHLVKRYGAFVAVDDVSFEIKEGEIFGIIGPNGAGKTTTVECISGLRAPDSGSISVYGLSPQRNRDKIRKLVGVQLQESALPPRIKVGEALNLFASFYSSPLDPNENQRYSCSFEKQSVSDIVPTSCRIPRNSCPHSI